MRGKPGGELSLRPREDQAPGETRTNSVDLSGVRIDK